MNLCDLLFTILRRSHDLIHVHLCFLETFLDSHPVQMLRVALLIQGDVEIKTRIAVPADFSRVMELMCQEYFKREPSLVNIGLANEDEPPAALVHHMHQQVKEGLTIIAEDKANCIVGAAINAGSCPWDPENMIEYADRCERGSVRDIMKFNAYVTKAPQLWNKYCVLKIFDCAAVAVDSKYLGMGIGKRLVKESWHLARDCGFQAFRIDCTSL